MTTEEKIREAYERITTESGFKQSVGGFICFKAGYLVMLNSLEPVILPIRGCVDMYVLPEGVTRELL